MAERQRAIKQLECEIPQMSPAKHKLFDKLFYHHLPQLLQQARTSTTSPRSTFAKGLVQRRCAAEEELYGAVT
jgi:hypothetical protein